MYFMESCNYVKQFSSELKLFCTDYAIEKADDEVRGKMGVGDARRHLVLNLLIKLVS